MKRPLAGIPMYRTFSGFVPRIAYFACFAYYLDFLSVVKVLVWNGNLVFEAC